MKARLLLKDRKIFHDGTIIERVVWFLPNESMERPHKLKYRLYCGRSGQCLIRYDNEAGKGDHRHYGEHEEHYSFTSLQQLLIDFDTDIKYLGNMS